ncbi:hypothetical protein [Caulobacter sp. FWC2]|uniref:hypothetical protein n=1 Tax=Caulobacter sp. FWC2 TaxID=69664 RepID=UPI0013045F3E|nr:hypothetical protein [Caulobacter sp. FWC2]
MQTIRNLMYGRRFLSHRVERSIQLGPVRVEGEGGAGAGPAIPSTGNLGSTKGPE